jgi:hypothetical protein
MFGAILGHCKVDGLATRQGGFIFYSYRSYVVIGMVAEIVSCFD